MFATWLTASETEVAEALRSQRTQMDPDYRTYDVLDPTGLDRYEAQAGVNEHHEQHHTNR